MTKFKVGDIVKHKGLNGGRFKVIEVYHEPKGFNTLGFDYRLQFLHTHREDTKVWNKAADQGKEVSEWEERLEYDYEYLRDIKLNQLVI